MDDLPKNIRQRLTELNMSVAELARRADINYRQVHRFLSGAREPSAGEFKRIADALDSSLDRLAGAESSVVDLAGAWWACWQSWQSGSERATPHEVAITQRGDHLVMVATTRGTSVEQGGYLWRGEARLYDNEAVIGAYVAAEGAIRSKGALYFALHPHGQEGRGRWVGLSHDGPIVSGWAAMAKTEQAVAGIMEELRTRTDPRTGNARP